MDTTVCSSDSIKPCRFNAIFNQSNVVVTGHTGFKGSWLCHWLERCGAQVHGYSLDPSPNHSLYDQLQLSERLKTDCRSDIRNKQRLESFITSINPSFIFHLAAQPIVTESYRKPLETFETNVTGTVNLLESARSLRSKCSVVVVTTDKCYKNVETLSAYRETDPLGGNDPYSASKAAAEIITHSYRNSFFSEGPIRVATARAGNVIGGGDWATDRIVPDCIRSIRESHSIAIRNQHATRPWQHVLEPLSGYLTLAGALDQIDRLRPRGQGANESDEHRFDSPFNFGPTIESNRTVLSLVNTIGLHIPNTLWHDASNPNSKHEATRLDLAVAKAHHLLNWRPVWGFGKTIKNTVSWYESERNGANMVDVTDRQISEYIADAMAKEIHWSAASLPTNIDTCSTNVLKKSLIAA